MEVDRNRRVTQAEAENATAVVNALTREYANAVVRAGAFRAFTFVTFPWGTIVWSGGRTMGPKNEALFKAAEVAAVEAFQNILGQSDLLKVTGSVFIDREPERRSDPTEEGKTHEG